MNRKRILALIAALITIGVTKAQDTIDIWNLPPLSIEQGRYTTDWDNLSRQYNTPAWWREAKLGAWSHWDPQSAAEDGDWYSRGMYMEGHPQSKFHREHFGHPSEYGYKELCRDWKTDLWDPEDLIQLYQKMGARYFLALGNHHDNFDCWNSKYQPWNSVNIGPHQDIVGIWEKVARKHNMPFGIGFHNTPARTWGQFMPVRYTSDKQGDKAGVPYDAMLTKADGYKPNADGTDKWWKGSKQMVTRIHLGLITDKGNLDSGLVLKLSTAAKIIKDDYTMVTGKRSHCTNRANEKTFTYTNANNMTLEAIVRLYNDGVAIRYRIPQGVKITDDCTSFYVADGKDR